MRTSSWKRIGVAAPVAGALAAFGVLAAQAGAGGSGDANLPVPAGMAVATARGVEPVVVPATADPGKSLAVDMNNWQETAAISGQRGSRRRF
jgi:hypothetical protein